MGRLSLDLIDIPVFLFGLAVGVVIAAIIWGLKIAVEKQKLVEFNKVLSERMENFQQLALRFQGVVEVLHVKSYAENRDLNMLKEGKSMTPDQWLTFTDQLYAVFDEIVERMGTKECVGLKTCKTGQLSVRAKNLFNQMSIEHSTYADLMQKLVVMITDTSNEVTAPLSGEIFYIKQAVADFINSLETWEIENRKKTDEEYDSVIDQFSLHSQKIQVISSSIESYNTHFRANLQQAMAEFVGITESTRQINEISERVKILSINAAIEAARAGEAGKGFKVIATEVQTLSLEIQTLSENISKKISGTNVSLKNVVQKFDSDSKLIAADLLAFNTELSSYDGDLASYHSAFIEIVAKIARSTREINRHIDALNPLFQLQDMTIQQVQHLSEIMQKIHGQKELLQDDPADIEVMQKEAQRTILLIAEQIATTDTELEVIRAVAKSSNLDLLPSSTSPKVAQAIEIF